MAPLKERHDLLRRRAFEIAAHLDLAATHDEHEAKFCGPIVALVRSASATFLRGEAKLLFEAAEEIEAPADKGVTAHAVLEELFALPRETRAKLYALIQEHAEAFVDAPRPVSFVTAPPVKGSPRGGRR